MKSFFRFLSLAAISAPAFATLPPVASVPEPSLAALMGAAAIAGGIIYLRNRRK